MEKPVFPMFFHTVCLFWFDTAHHYISWLVGKIECWLRSRCNDLRMRFYVFNCFLNCDHIFPIKFKSNQIIWNSRFWEFVWKIHWKSLRQKAYRSNKVNQLNESQSLKNVGWGDFLSVLPSKRPSVHPSVHPSVYPSKAWLAGWLWGLTCWLWGFIKNNFGLKLA